MKTKKMTTILSGAVVSALVAGSVAFAADQAKTTTHKSDDPSASAKKDGCSGKMGCDGMDETSTKNAKKASHHNAAHMNKMHAQHKGMEHGD